jgi:hypothetical protein
LSTIFTPFNRHLTYATTTDILIATARNLCSNQPQNLTSDAAALTPVMALLSHHPFGRSKLDRNRTP